MVLDVDIPSGGGDDGWVPGPGNSLPPVYCLLTLKRVTWLGTDMWERGLAPKSYDG